MFQWVCLYGSNIVEIAAVRTRGGTWGDGAEDELLLLASPPTARRNDLETQGVYGSKPGSDPR